jgi:hypothetical protein
MMASPRTNTYGVASTMPMGREKNKETKKVRRLLARRRRAVSRGIAYVPQHLYVEFEIKGSPMVGMSGLHRERITGAGRQ